MYEMQPPDGEPQVRFIVTCPHGGSTFLMTIFQNHPLCAVTDASAPQYLSLEDLSHHSAFTNVRDSGKPFLICTKELSIDDTTG